MLEAFPKACKPSVSPVCEGDATQGRVVVLGDDLDFREKQGCLLTGEGER